MTMLACPNCGNTTLYSDEVASIMYDVQLTRADDGSVQVEYLGTDYVVCDEGTEYRANIWCRSCGTQITEDQLAPAPATR